MKARVNKRFDFSFDNNEFDWDCVDIKDGEFHILFNGRSFVACLVEARPSRKEFVFRINNNNYHVLLKDKYDELLHSLGMDGFNSHQEREIKAPMPGRVLDVMLGVGDFVKKGDSVVVLEAMKMENVIKSPTDGIIKRVVVLKGCVVDKNDVLIEFG